MLTQPQQASPIEPELGTAQPQLLLIKHRMYYHKPTIDDFTNSIVALRDHCIKHGIAYLAMPKLGKNCVYNLAQ
jgi:hypothetical protein